MTTTLLEDKQEAENLALKLEAVLKRIEKASEERLEDYREAWGDRALETNDPLVERTHRAESAVEGARQGIQQTERILANSIVWEDY